MGPCQRGAALIVALIMLLVMTILGITAMNSAVLQTFMSTSFQNQSVTLTGVENVVLAGERQIEQFAATGVPTPTPSHFFNLLDTPPMPASFSAGAIQFPAASASEVQWGLGFGVPNEVMGPMSILGRYVIEYIGEFEVPGESIAEGGGLEDSRIHIFRVSARGVEQGRGGLRIVQTYYVTLRGPEGA